MKYKLCLSFMLTAALVMLAPATGQTVSVVETTGSQSELLATQPSVSFGTATGGTYTITLTPSVEYQEMDGFGASFTDTSTYLVYNKLTSAQQATLMTNLFNSTSGIGLTWLRQPMGASDMSAQGDFSYDDLPSGETDVPLADFSIAKDLTYTIPVLKQALAVNPNIKIEMLPWSPPAWMKTSGTMNGGNFNDTYMPSLAQYFVKAIQAYQSELGTTIYAVNPQNEPENSNSSYPTEAFSATEEEEFIANDLGPALASAGLSPKILGYEHNWGDTTYPETLLAYSPAAPYLAGISWHCYAGAVSAQTTVHNAYPNSGTWFTECTTSSSSTNFSSNLGWDMENLLIGGTTNWAKSVSEWNLATDQNYGPQNGGCTNCTGFVTINDSASPATITYNESYYAYGQFAKFVQPGAYRIQSNSASAGSGGIEDVAFKNPNGSIALVVYNDATSSQTFDINWSPNNTNLVYTLPASSVATFTWTPSTGVCSAVPSAPTGLSATASSSSAIGLSWSAVTPPTNCTISSYSVFRSTTSGFTPSSSNLVASGLTGTTYSNTGLTASTTYYYKVEAVDSYGTSAASAQASATTTAACAAVPSAPTGLTATASSSVAIGLSWTADTAPANCSISSYSVYGSTTSGFTPSSSNSLASGVTGTTYTNTGLTAKTTYYYKVEAVDAYGTSAASTQTSATTLSAPVISTTSYYTITNEASGMCLDDTGGSTANGTVLQQYTCTSGDVNQDWLFTATSGGYYEVTTYNSSTLGWDVVNLGTSPGTDMQLWTYGGGLNQQFEPVLLSTGYYEFIDHNSGLCLNVPGGAATNNLQLQINTCNGATSESFTLAAVTPPTYYQIVNEASGMCVDDTGGSTSNGTVLQQYTCAAIGTNANQEWLLTDISGSYYEITTRNSSTLAWNVVNSGTSSGTDMQLWTYGGGLNEQFERVLLSTGYYEFIDHNSGLCVNVPGGAATNNLQLQISTCNSSTSESFKLNAVQ